MAGPVVRFRVDFAEHCSLGPGKILLLEAIRDSGSLSLAAHNIGMSYRRAWDLVESLKESFREPVTVASTGGKDGGGMLVTEFGDALIKAIANWNETLRRWQSGVCAPSLQGLSGIPSLALRYRYARSLSKAAIQSLCSAG